MFFYVNAQKQTVVAASKLGLAAKMALHDLGIDLVPGEDPVKAAREALYNIGCLQNLSEAFDSIAQSDNSAAQELADQYSKAVGVFHDRK